MKKKCLVFGCVKYTGLVSDVFCKHHASIDKYNKRKSIARGRAYMICIFCVLVGIMLSEFVRRVF